MRSTSAEKADTNTEPTLQSNNLSHVLTPTNPQAAITYAPITKTISGASNPNGARPECFRNTLSECLFVLTTAFATGQTSVLLGALVTITARISDDLNASDAATTWLLAGQTLTAGSFLLFFGRVADLFGRRVIFITAMGSFTVFVLIAGFSKNIVMLEVFLALAGISCAAVFPPAIGKLGAIYAKPSRRKNRAFACFSAGNPIGFVIGAFVSGVTAKISTWRAVLWVITVIYGAFTIIAWFTTPKDFEQSLGGLNLETAKKMDWLGALLVVSGICMFTAALTVANDASHGWATGYVIALLVVGVVLMAAFLYWQSIFKYPLMPLHVWKDKNFSILVASLCLGFYGFQGNFFWLTLGWQEVYRDSPLEVAVKLLPAVVGGIFINVLAGLLMHRVSNKLLFIVGAVASVASCALLSATSTKISYWALSFTGLVCAVTGGDFAFTVTNMYVMSSLPSEQQSVAGGMFQTATRLASVVGLGVATTVFSSAGGSSIARNAGVAPSWHPYRAAFWVSLVGAVVGLLITPWLKLGTQGGRSNKPKSMPDLSSQAVVPEDGEVKIGSDIV